MRYGKKQSKGHMAKKKQKIEPVTKFVSIRRWLCPAVGLKYILIAVVWVISIAIAFIIAYTQDLPDVSELNNIIKKPSITIRTEDGTVLAKYGDIYGIDLKECPLHLSQALLATEDRRFYSHHGVDIWGTIRALYANYMAGYAVQGGSTITQQLAKITFLTSEKSWKRKIQEALLAFNIERKYSKSQIMMTYLNRAYFGRGVYGVDGAAHYYFGKSATGLNLYEAAILVGMLKSPNRYSPSNNYDLSITRAKQVLFNMRAVGYISQRDIFYAQPPLPLAYGQARGALSNPYFTDYVLEELQERLGSIRRDVDIYTTLDMPLQQALEASLQTVMRNKPKMYKVDEAAAVVLGPNGSLLAMMGGTSYQKSQFNRATQALRQPGSAFKLFVYLAALEYGYNLETLVEDKPITIKGWSPHNINHRYAGQMTLATAFAKSTNTVAVQLTAQLGQSRVIEMARRLGLTSPLAKVPSIALGTSEVTLLELTGAYAHITNNGKSLRPFAITKVVDANNKLLYKRSNVTGPTVLTATVNNNMRQLLRGVITNGTGKAAEAPGEIILGKTGTSQAHKDAYFVGSLEGKRPITVGIWVGNDNNSPTHNMVGGGLPVSIWRNFMLRSGLILGYKNDISLPSGNAFAILQNGEQ